MNLLPYGYDSLAFASGVFEEDQEEEHPELEALADDEDGSAPLLETEQAA